MAPYTSTLRCNCSSPSVHASVDLASDCGPNPPPESEEEGEHDDDDHVVQVEDEISPNYSVIQHPDTLGEGGSSCDKDFEPVALPYPERNGKLESNASPHENPSRNRDEKSLQRAESNANKNIHVTPHQNIYGNITSRDSSTAILGDLFGNLYISNTTYQLSPYSHSPYQQSVYPYYPHQYGPLPFPQNPYPYPYPPQQYVPPPYQWSTYPWSPSLPSLPPYPKSPYQQSSYQNPPVPTPDSHVERVNHVLEDHSIETITTFCSGKSSGGSVYETKRRWDRKECLGTGVFDEVHREECIANGVIASRVVKVLRSQQLKQFQVDHKKEIKALLRFSQPQYEHLFVQYFSWSEDSAKIYLFMEYIANGDLTRCIGSGLSATDAKQIGHQVLNGIQVMHRLDVVHRDIKPGNIFVVHEAPKWLVKIGDFGISKSTVTGPMARRTSVGTTAYEAPEIMGLIPTEKEAHYDAKCDIWSYGCTMYEILFGTVPFPNASDLVHYCAEDGLPKSSKLAFHALDMDGKDFLVNLLTPLPADRPSARQAIKIGRGWFTSIK